MNDSLSQHCPNCEAQAAEIEKLRGKLRLFLSLVDDPDYDFGELCEEFIPIARAALGETK